MRFDGLGGGVWMGISVGMGIVGLSRVEGDVSPPSRKSVRLGRGWEMADENTDMGVPTSDNIFT